jgi:hypothetical protein
MTQDQHQNLQRAAWQHREDLEAAIYAETQNQEPYSLGGLLYRRPSRWRKVPKSVWFFLAAVVAAALIIAF